MYPFFVRNVTSPAIDFLSGRQTISRFKELMKTQWFSDTELTYYQEKKLRSLILHAYSNVPFYRKLFQKNHLHPNDIHSIADLEKIPIIDKQTLKNAVNYPNDLFASNLPHKRINFGSTGGTTGSPLVLAKDVNTRSYGWAAFWRWETWMGLNHGDKTAMIWGQHVVDKSKTGKIKDHFLDLLSNKFTLNGFNPSVEDLASFAKQLQNKKPKHIHGYTTALVAFSYYIQENGIELPHMQVSTTAEVLEPFQRDVLMKTFQGEVFDQYGCGECGSIAFECEAHEGLHISAEHVLVESIENNRQNIGNNSGDVVITDLDSYFMPIIRYKNGDLLELANDECSCGRKLPLIKKIDGRVTDLLFCPDGRFVHHGYFITVLNDLGWSMKYNILKYQVIQTTINHFEWNFIVTVEPTQKDVVLLENRIQMDCPGVDVNINFVDSIPNEPSGKFQYTKNLIRSK